MSNPNTVEGLSPEEKIEEIAKKLSPGHQQFVKDQIDNEWGYLISDIAQAHTTQTLDRMKCQVEGLDTVAHTELYPEDPTAKWVNKSDVLQLIEEVSDE